MVERFDFYDDGVGEAEFGDWVEFAKVAAPADCEHQWEDRTVCNTRGEPVRSFGLWCAKGCGATKPRDSEVGL